MQKLCKPRKRLLRLNYLFSNSKIGRSSINAGTYFNNIDEFVVTYKVYICDIVKLKNK